jgi:hypothetical protein
LEFSSSLSPHPLRIQNLEDSCETRSGEGQAWSLRQWFRSRAFRICLGTRWLGQKKEERAQTFETESIVVRPPDMVKGPPHLPKLEIYPAFIISENIDCVGERLNQLGHGLPLVDPVHRCRVSKVEMGILRDR